VIKLPSTIILPAGNLIVSTLKFMKNPNFKIRILQYVLIKYASLVTELISLNHRMTKVIYNFISHLTTTLLLINFKRQTSEML